MFYSANGKFIIKENFETDRLETKAKDNNSLDIWHYDVNGNLRTGTKVSKNGNYEIWTGFCYDNNCPAVYGKNKPNLVVDKDGTTYVKKLCFDDICLSRKQNRINNFFANLLIKALAEDLKLDNVEDLTDAELDAILSKVEEGIETTETNFESEDNETT